MKKIVLRVLPVLAMFFIYPIASEAQKGVAVGARGGLSFFGYGSGTSAGLQIGPTIDYEFQPSLYLCSDLTVNTQSGTPVEWANSLKYHLPSSQANMQPY